MEQLVLILLVVLISIINWIVQKSKERREKRRLEKRADTTGEPVPKGPSAQPPETQTETAMRRLREALGLPEEAEPPVIPKRAQQEAPPRPAPPPLPQPAKKPVARVPFTPPRLEHRKFELPHLKFRKFDLPHRLAKPVAEVEVRRQPSRIRELLGSAGGLRDAVVLAEILGPPKSLREGDFRS
jgi:hypothetical protein